MPKETEELKKLKKKLKNIKSKDIRFHKDFDKGKRIALCLKCGYPVVFYGAMRYKGDLTIANCSCKKPKFKEFSFDKFNDFILKIQDINQRISTRKPRKDIESFVKKQRCKYCNEHLTPGCWRMIHVKGNPLFFCNYQCQIHWTIKSKRVVIDDELIDLVKTDTTLRNQAS